MNAPKARPAEIEKLTPGTLASYEYARWGIDQQRSVVIYDQQYATREWATPPRIVTAISDEEFSPFPAGHPWGVPGWATAVREADGRKTWIRTSCLEPVGWTQKQPEQAELFTADAINS
jgi:hypothetical protein